jgi:hypothetical protein
MLENMANVMWQIHACRDGGSAGSPPTRKSSQEDPRLTKMRMEMGPNPSRAPRIGDVIAQESRQLIEMLHETMAAISSDDETTGPSLKDRMHEVWGAEVCILYGRISLYDV